MCEEDQMSSIWGQTQAEGDQESEENSEWTMLCSLDTLLCTNKVAQQKHSKSFKGEPMPLNYIVRLQQTHPEHIIINEAPKIRSQYNSLLSNQVT